jgi:hypothetical protein
MIFLNNNLHQILHHLLEKKDCVQETMVSSSCEKKKRDYSKRSYEKEKLAKWEFLEDENLIELTFKGSGGTGCKYATHSRRFRSTKLYMIPCTFTMEHQIFISIFQEKKDVNIEQGMYIHACHKICERCLSKFKVDGRQCNICPNLVNIDYTIHCKEIMNVWNCRDFIITYISQYHEIVEGCKNFIQRKGTLKLATSGLVVQCEIKPFSALYQEVLGELKLPHGIKLHITFSNIPSQYSLQNPIKPYWDDVRFNNNKLKWEDIYKDNGLITTTSTSLAIFNGGSILQGTSKLQLPHLIALYLPEAYESTIYHSTLRMINVYYETSPPYGNKSHKNPKHGVYKNRSHGYSSNAGVNVDGDIVPYHNAKISLAAEKAFKDMGDECASNIWHSLLPKFGEVIDYYFYKQAYSTQYICVGLEDKPTNVAQLHISKNSFIKPHIDPLDLESSIISWFTNGEPHGGEFGLFQMLYKFKTNNAPGLFLQSEEFAHGTLHFDTRGNELDNYTLGVALTNKKWLKTRSTNQLIGNTREPRRIPSKKHWYTIDPQDT